MTSATKRWVRRHRTHGRSRTPVPPKQRVPSILFVDDDPDIQTVFELRMRPYAVEIDHAYFGTQGIVQAIKNKPDLILMDVAMPNGNGEYLLQTIRRNHDTAQIPVVVLTGMRDPTIRNRVLRLGADAFLSKPVPIDELIHQIGRFVDLQRLPE